MATFKVGDRVRCVKSFANADTVNELGTIVAKGASPEMYGVNFDKFIHGHSLDGKGINGHGWWIPEDMLEKVRNDSKIIIMADGYTVTAKLVRDKNRVAVATAKCSPDDDFNILVGAQIALQRLAEKQNAKIVLNTKAFGKDIELI